MVLAWVASLNVTLARTEWAPGAARTETANGELVRLDTAFPSRLKTTRSII